MFRPSDPQFGGRENPVVGEADRDARRASPLPPGEEIERDESLGADEARDAEVREELSHGPPDGAPPDGRSRHQSTALFYILAAVAAVGVMGAMWLIGGSGLALATVLIFPAFFLIAVMPVWNAMRMRTQDRVEVETHMIERDGAGPRDDSGRPAPKVNPIDA